MKLGFTVLAAALLLGACASSTTPPPDSSIPSTENREQSLPPAPAQDMPEDIPPPKVITPAELIGQTPKEVQNTLGEPSLVRRDDDVQAMLFEKATCVLEIIFREPSPSEYFKAVHIAARDRTGTDTSAEVCLSSFALQQK